MGILKIIRFFLLTTTFVSIAQAQFGHIPPNHDHPGSVCYGYAMGRAYGKTSWENDPGGCNLNTLHPNQLGGEAGSVDPAYFDFSTVLSTLKVGDVLAFEQDGSIFGHVAYVSYVRQDGKYDVDSTRVDQVDGYKAGERKNIRLRDVIEGNIPIGINPHGLPAGKYFKKAFWNGTIKNQFSDGTNGGTVRVVIPTQGEYHLSYAGQPNLTSRFWGEALTIDAEMNGQEVNGLTQIFLNWSGRTESIGLPSSQESPLYINWPYTQTPEIKATFRGKLLVSGTKIIQSGVTTTIDQNTIIDIQANSELVVYGKLLVNGTSSQHVTFAPTSGTWQGIRFEESGANNSVLNYCDINYAAEPIKATNSSNLTISNCTIGNSYFGPTAAISLAGCSTVTITSTQINGLPGSWGSGSNNGIRFSQASTGSVQSCTMQDLGSGNGIVITGGSYPTISNNTIQNNGYHGITVVSNGVNSNGPNNPRIYANNLSNNGFIEGERFFHGIYVTGSSGIVRQNSMNGSLHGINCDGGSLIWSEEVNSGWWDRGDNFLNSNTYGLVADGNSTAFFGRADYDGQDTYYYGACNVLYGNDIYDAWAPSGSIIAIANYWGQYPPNYSKISGVYVDPASQYPGDCDPDYGGGGCELCASASQNSEIPIDEL